MGIDPTVVTFLLACVPVILVVGIALFAFKCAEWHISVASRLIGRPHRSSESSEASVGPGRSEHSDATTLVGSDQDVEKGQTNRPGSGQEAEHSYRCPEGRPNV